MLPKDFENYELRLRKLQESARELYVWARKIFEERYEKRLEGVFSGDTLGTLSKIRTIFCVQLCEEAQVWEQNYETFLRQAIQKACSFLPLSLESREILFQALLESLYESDSQIDFFRENTDFKRDPIFPLLEDIFADGKLSGEEMLLLEKHYRRDKNLKNLVQTLPEKSRNHVSCELGDLASFSLSERKEYMQQEFSSDLQHLKKRGYETEALMVFVSQSYYVPKKRFETPKQRLKRTFKMALLRLLCYRFWNIDIEKLLKQFETLENFQDYFLLLYRLFEILGEETEVQEVFHREEKKEVVKHLLETATERKKKILAGEKVTAKISDLVSKTDSVIETWVLSALLEDNTHFLGQEIYFAHSDTLAWIYAESQKLEEEDEQIEEITQGKDTLLWKYEALKAYFFELDERKRKAFAQGEYDEIERLNDILFRLDSQMQKLAVLLGIFDEEGEES